MVMHSPLRQPNSFVETNMAKTNLSCVFICVTEYCNIVELWKIFTILHLKQQCSFWLNCVSLITRFKAMTIKMDTYNHGYNHRYRCIPSGELNSPNIMMLVKCLWVKKQKSHANCIQEPHLAIINCAFKSLPWSKSKHSKWTCILMIELLKWQSNRKFWTSTVFSINKLMLAIWLKRKSNSNNKHVPIPPYFWLMRFSFIQEKIWSRETLKRYFEILTILMR